MASARARDGRFTGLYRDGQGRQRSAGTYDTQRAALKAARAAEALAASGIDPRPAQTEMLHPSSRRGKTTVAAYAPTWLAGHRLEPTSKATYQAMLKHITRELGSVTLADLDAPRCRAFIRQAEAAGLSGSTVGLIMTVLRAMCETAVADGLMARDVTSGIKIAGRHAQEIQVLSPLEYRRVLAATPVHYQLLVQALVSTGMRWGEAMGLQLGDVSKRGTGYVISIRRVMIEVAGRVSLRGYGKTPGATREVTIDRDLGEALIESARQDPDDGFVFRAEKGGVLHRSNFRRVWIKALALAGLSGYRVHSLRHSHASWLLANGAKLVEVRDRFGP